MVGDSWGGEGDVAERLSVGSLGDGSGSVRELGDGSCGVGDRGVRVGDGGGSMGVRHGSGGVGVGHLGWGKGNLGYGSSVGQLGDWSSVGQFGDGSSVGQLGDGGSVGELGDRGSVSDLSGSLLDGGAFVGDLSVEAVFLVGGVVHDAADTVGLHERVRALHSVAGARLLLLLHVTAVAVVHGVVAYVEPEAPAHYEFNYSVQDSHSGDVKQQQESRAGDAVQGSYSLVQPDGVRRIVHYSADHEHGFNAEVSYEGTPIAHAPAKIAVAAPVAYAAPIAKVAYTAPVAKVSYAPAAVSYAHTPVAYAAPVAKIAYAAPVAHVSYASPAISYHH
ncbi:unnamed protein product [Chrysodeixis includens]|uniref:Cuticle protein n=1 Tax=Chrysodeixis includens TaxID=689277 RepID=A0A9P0BT91_CHRIL|nr:unnamed protein product [Chrysodeixis includens]